MVADKGKKQKVAEKNEEENNEEIDGDLVLSIEKLQEIQDELDKINEKASDEVLSVEQKYNEIRKPVYDKRNEIINSIPDFWLTAFMSHPVVVELLTSEDQKIFKFLSSLEVEDAKDVKSGYSITFNFKPNPYFEDTKLVKTFTFLDEGTTKVTSTSIKWKEGTGIPNGVTNDKGKKRTHAEESFFSWFSQSQPKELMDELHDEVADVIKDDLWPNPLNYFYNENDPEESGGEEGNDEEEEDGSDDEGQDEDDEEDR